jgi:hypothetical protein
MLCIQPRNPVSGEPFNCQTPRDECAGPEACPEPTMGSECIPMPFCRHVDDHFVCTIETTDYTEC